MSRFAERKGKNKQESSASSLMVIVVTLCAALFMGCIVASLFLSGDHRNLFQKVSPVSVPLSQQVKATEVAAVFSCGGNRNATGGKPSNGSVVRNAVW